MASAERFDVQVEYDYQATEDDELTILPGEIITDVECSDGGWWSGTLRDKRGVFPDNFVKIIGKSQAKSAPTKKAPMVPVMSMDKPTEIVVPQHEPEGRGNKKKVIKAKVVYPYTPANDDELELVMGDVIEIVEKSDENWWEGELDGKRGMFPSNFVEVIDDSAKEVKPKKVIGVGFGDIFAGGEAPKLRPTTKAASVDSPGDTKPNPVNIPKLPATSRTSAPKVPTSNSKKPEFTNAFMHSGNISLVKHSHHSMSSEAGSAVVVTIEEDTVLSVKKASPDAVSGPLRPVPRVRRRAESLLKESKLTPVREVGVREMSMKLLAASEPRQLYAGRYESSEGTSPQLKAVTVETPRTAPLVDKNKRKTVLPGIKPARKFADLTNRLSQKDVLAAGLLDDSSDEALDDHTVSESFEVGRGRPSAYTFRKTSEYGGRKMGHGRILKGEEAGGTCLGTREITSQFSLKSLAPTVISSDPNAPRGVGQNRGSGELEQVSRGKVFMDNENTKLPGYDPLVKDVGMRGEGMMTSTPNAENKDVYMKSNFLSDSSRTTVGTSLLYTDADIEDELCMYSEQVPVASDALELFNEPISMGSISESAFNMDAVAQSTPVKEQPAQTPGKSAGKLRSVFRRPTFLPKLGRSAKKSGTQNKDAAPSENSLSSPQLEIKDHGRKETGKTAGQSSSRTPRRLQALGRRLRQVFSHRGHGGNRGPEEFELEEVALLENRSPNSKSSTMESGVNNHPPADVKQAPVAPNLRSSSNRANGQGSEQQKVCNYLNPTTWSMVNMVDFCNPSSSCSFERDSRGDCPSVGSFPEELRGISDQRSISAVLHDSPEVVLQSQNDSSMSNLMVQHSKELGAIHEEEVLPIGAGRKEKQDFAIRYKLQSSHSQTPSSTCLYSSSETYLSHLKTTGHVPPTIQYIVHKYNLTDDETEAEEREVQARQLPKHPDSMKNLNMNARSSKAKGQPSMLPKVENTYWQETFDKRKSRNIFAGSQSNAGTLNLTKNAYVRNLYKPTFGKDDKFGKLGKNGTVHESIEKQSTRADLGNIVCDKIGELKKQRLGAGDDQDKAVSLQQNQSSSSSIMQTKLRTNPFLKKAIPVTKQNPPFVEEKYPKTDVKETARRKCNVLLGSEGRLGHDKDNSLQTWLLKDEWASEEELMPGKDKTGRELRESEALTVKESATSVASNATSGSENYFDVPSVTFDESWGWAFKDTLHFNNNNRVPSTSPPPRPPPPSEGSDDPNLLLEWEDFWNCEGEVHQADDLQDTLVQQPEQEADLISLASSASTAFYSALNETPPVLDLDDSLYGEDTRGKDELAELLNVAAQHSSNFYELTYTKMSGSSSDED